MLGASHGEYSSAESTSGIDGGGGTTAEAR
jgi:hypothetical protein